MRRTAFTTLALLASFAAAGPDALANRVLIGARPQNLADFTPAARGTRDPVARFAAVIAAADFSHRASIEQAHRRLESEIDAEIQHRVASGAKLSRFELRELTDARAMLRSSLATMMAATEDTWERSRRQAQITLETLRLAYFALQPQQLAIR